MNFAVIDRWNSVVTDEDIVWNLGDFMVGSGARPESFVSHLHHKHINLILGNHDRLNKLRFAGFALIVKRRVCRVGEDLILLSHKPVLPNLWPAGVTMHFCGHKHEAWKFSPKYMALNVGVDVWNFTPVRLDDAIEAWHHEASFYRPQS